MLPPPNANYILPPYQGQQFGTNYGLGNGIGLMGPGRSLNFPGAQQAGMPPMMMGAMPMQQPMMFQQPMMMQPPIMMQPPMMMQPPQQQSSGMGSLLALAAPMLGNLFGEDSGFSFGADRESALRQRADRVDRADRDDEDCVDCRPRSRLIERLPEGDDGSLVLPDRDMRAGNHETEASANDLPRRRRYTPASVTTRTVPQTRTSSNRESYRVASASNETSSAKPNMGDRVALPDGDDQETVVTGASVERSAPKPAQKPKLAERVVEKPRPAPRREVVRPSDRKPSPGQLAEVRTRVPYNNRRAQGVPTLWDTLINKLAICAPGCVPRGYNSYATHGHIRNSCHYQSRAIDIEALSCPSGTIQAKRGGFRNIVKCLDRIERQGTKTMVIYLGGKHSKSDHDEHMHFSIGCHGGRKW